MSIGKAFKAITPNQIRFNKFYTHREWLFNGSNYTARNIQIEYGKKAGPFKDYTTSSVNSSNVYPSSLYDWAVACYYGKPVNSAEYLGDWGLNTTASLHHQFHYIGIPHSVYGEYIQPGSLELKYKTITLSDDGQGNLFDVSNHTHVGNVFYSNGDVFVTNTGSYYNDFTASQFTALKFKGSLPIEVFQANCQFSAYELNTPTNPTAFNSTSSFSRPGLLRNEFTGSNWRPYISTIGIYDDQHRCIAIGRLAKPLLKSGCLSTTVIVRIDY